MIPISVPVCIQSFITPSAVVLIIFIIFPAIAAVAIGLLLQKKYGISSALIYAVLLDALFGLMTVVSVIVSVCCFIVIIAALLLLLLLYFYFCCFIVFGLIVADGRVAAGPVECLRSRVGSPRLRRCNGGQTRRVIISKERML